MMYHFYKKINNQQENCFNVETKELLTNEEIKILKQLLSDNFVAENIQDQSALGSGGKIVELGPRLNFATAFSTNAVSICRSIGLNKVIRLEISRRYILPAGADEDEFIRAHHDRMTECRYLSPLENFNSPKIEQPVFPVPMMEEGIGALQKINKALGLGMDAWDEEFYYNLFIKHFKRNPTNVECFQLGQANSEHSRHWFFRGKLIIDDQEITEDLLDIVRQTLNVNPGNSIIAFKDNSSAIRGYEISTIAPDDPVAPAKFKKENNFYNFIFTAETHNFPTGVAPFPGAETGAGGRIRDVQATGRGALVVAGTTGYCVGNLNIPNYNLPWENKNFVYPDNLARPLKIIIDASNGASDYGNKFGEPLIQGFTRSFGLTFPNGERREWLKPIMFTGGVGQIDNEHIKKEKPEKGMLIIQVGGPAYRIGMGGGSASSQISGTNAAELDFNAVQRGDGEMEQKMNRVIRACIEMGSRNPIMSIHDQGAGGPCNVITEIVEPAGGKVEIRNIKLGDATLSVLEIWGAEYQERNALLIRPEQIDEFKKICERERCDLEVLGEVTGDGKITVHDEKNNSTPIDLELDKILGKMPQKIFKDERINLKLKPLELPEDLTLKLALDKVLRLLSVGSKRFLINKVDRSVTGLIAQQQCVGPLHLSLADVSVIAQSHFSLTGAAIAIGEQPIKMLINSQAGARLSVAEALTNIVWAKISALEDIKCSGNWMWAAKLPGEATRIYDAAIATRDLMIDLGIAIDGGKDSLSMAAKVKGEIIKAPGELTISAYAPVEDINKVITPDLKHPGQSEIWLIDLGAGKCRLGGSALAQVFNQLGDESPDVDDPQVLKNSFVAVQKMIAEDIILSGHDRSDGGLITALLEMAFAGNCGFDADLLADQKCGSAHGFAIEYFFNEELGLIVEVDKNKKEEFKKIIREYNLGNITSCLGATTLDPRIKITAGDKNILNEDMRDLRQIWEETGHQLEKLQVDPACALEEKENIYDQKAPEYKITFEPKLILSEILEQTQKPRVAIIREEGSNGDREMASAFYSAGFEVWDVAMSDLLNDKINLDNFRGLAFVGGFSYADCLGSAKGWAGTIRFNTKLKKMFADFYNRPDTFSLGVCNGCQLMTNLGLVPWQGIKDESQPRFVHNKSGRFESRWSTVKIMESPSIMFKDMAGSTLGIWVAHGEGQLSFSDEKIFQEVKAKKLTPLSFVDDHGNPTEKYPFNPNGSREGITALCSPDGRHLAMMPHPERVFLKWQWPWMPEEWRKNLKASPWLKMFQNARTWCEK